MESQSLNYYLIFYSIFIGLCAAVAIGFFWNRVSRFQRDLHAMATDLHDSEQYKHLTTETVDRLGHVFQRIPSMARCFQIFRQSLIPPHTPHTQYFRSSRDAMLTFDRTYILKNSLSLGFFHLIPGALISLGVLGTIIAFAYCIKNAAPLFNQTDLQSLSGVVEGLFLFGAKSFWPAAVALVGGLASQLTFHVQSQKADETLQSLVTYVDTIVTPTNIEQISSESLIEMKMQHETINKFTEQFYNQMTGVLDKLAKEYVVPVATEISQIGPNYLKPMQSDVQGIAKGAGRMEEALAAFHSDMKNSMHELQFGVAEKLESLETVQVQFNQQRTQEHLTLIEQLVSTQSDFNTGLGNVFQAMQNLEQASVESDSHRRDEMNELIRAINLSVDSLSETNNRSTELLIKAIDKGARSAGQTLSNTEKFVRSELGEAKKDLQFQVRKMQENVEKTIEDSLDDTQNHIRKELRYIESEVAQVGRAASDIDALARDVRDIGNFLETIPLSQIEVVHVPRQLRSNDRNEEESERRRRKNHGKAS